MGLPPQADYVAGAFSMSLPPEGNMGPWTVATKAEQHLHSLRGWLNGPENGASKNTKDKKSRPTGNALSALLRGGVSAGAPARSSPRSGGVRPLAEWAARSRPRGSGLVGAPRSSGAPGAPLGPVPTTHPLPPRGGIFRPFPSQ